MAYTPLNLQIFTAAYAGALAGMGVSGRVPVDQLPANYSTLAAIAGAFAAAYDTEWGNVRTATTLNVSAVAEQCEAAWENRTPRSILPNSFATQVKALIAQITAGENYFAGEGIVPPAIGGGGGGGSVFYTSVTTDPTRWPTGQADTSSNVFSSLLEIPNIVIAAASRLSILSTWSAVMYGDTTLQVFAEFLLKLNDDIIVGGSEIRQPVAGAQNFENIRDSGALSRIVNVVPGTYTVTLQWRVAGPASRGLYIAEAAQPYSQHGSLTVSVLPA